MVLHFEEGQSLKGWLKGLGRAPRQKELDAKLKNLEVVKRAEELNAMQQELEKASRQGSPLVSLAAKVALSLTNGS